MTLRVEQGRTHVEQGSRQPLKLSLGWLQQGKNECSKNSARSGVPRGAEGASRPGRHFRKGDISGKNVQFYVKNGQIYVKKVISYVNSDKRAKIIGGGTGQKGAAEGRQFIFVVND